MRTGFISGRKAVVAMQSNSLIWQDGKWINQDGEPEGNGLRGILTELAYVGIGVLIVALFAPIAHAQSESQNQIKMITPYTPATWHSLTIQGNDNISTVIAPRQVQEFYSQSGSMWMKPGKSGESNWHPDNYDEPKIAERGTELGCVKTNDPTILNCNERIPMPQDAGSYDPCKINEQSELCKFLSVPPCETWNTTNLYCKSKGVVIQNVCNVYPKLNGCLKYPDGVPTSGLKLMLDEWAYSLSVRDIAENNYRDAKMNTNHLVSDIQLLLTNVNPYHRGMVVSKFFKQYKDRKNVTIKFVITDTFAMLEESRGAAIDLYGDEITDDGKFGPVDYIGNAFDDVNTVKNTGMTIIDNELRNIHVLTPQSIKSINRLRYQWRD